MYMCIGSEQTDLVLQGELVTITNSTEYKDFRVKVSQDRNHGEEDEENQESERHRKRYEKARI